MLDRFLKMVIIAATLFIVQSTVYPSLALGSEQKDCSCPKVLCSSCQKKVSIGKEVKFCSWGNINVCKKYVCENVSFYFDCLSKLKNRGPKVKTMPAKAPVKKLPKKLVLDYEKSKNRSKKKKRSPASIGNEVSSDEINYDPPGLKPMKDESRVQRGPLVSFTVVGKIVKSINQLEVIHHQKKGWAQSGQKLFVGDELINSSTTIKTVSIQFDSGKVSLDLSPQSKIKVLDPNSILGRFQPLLHLLKGQVLVEVDMKKGAFDLLAAGLIARGKTGNFLAILDKRGEDIEVKIENHQHRLTVLKSFDLSDVGVTIEPGHSLGWYSEHDTDFSNTEGDSSVHGIITPIFDMTKERKKQLGLLPTPKQELFAQWKRPKETGSRRPASSNPDVDALCLKPQGKFQQCAWSCQGNPKGSRECQAEKEKTHCVRRICGAGGQWGQATPFASSYKDLCPPTGIRVGSCRP